MEENEAKELYKSEYGAGGSRGSEGSKGGEYSLVGDVLNQA